MKGTRVLYSEKVDAAGRYVSAKTGLPIAKVFGHLLALAVETYPLTVLPDLVTECERVGAEDALSDQHKKDPDWG